MQTRSYKLMLVLLAVLLGSHRVASASALIVNGDFETGDLSGWTPYVTANGTIGSPMAVPFDVTGSGDSFAAQVRAGELSFNGLQEGGGLRQTFLSGSGPVTLSADIASTLDRGSNVDFGTFSLLLDGSPVVSQSFGTGFAPFTFRGSLSFAGTLSAGSHELALQVTRQFIVASNAPTQYFDNVIVDGPSPPSAVPEPLSLALVVAGLAGVAVSRKTRRAQQA